MGENENEKQKLVNRSTIFNNWVTVITSLLVVSALLTGWAKGVLDLPDRIKNLEQAQTPLKEVPAHVSSLDSRVSALETRLESVEKDNAKKTELLIRMDERLKTIQDRMGIPHE